MHLYKQLYKKLVYLEEDQKEQIFQAYVFAKDAHINQKREGGESYITHPVIVAELLAEMHMDHECIMASLLHDVVEDTPSTKDDIEKKFGKTVADLVDGVTKLTKIESTTKAETQAESFRKMILAMSNDIRVILIKLTDRTHNMRTLSGLAPHKRKRIARETLDIYAPIANRLGLHVMSIELENLAFAALYPRRHRVLSKAVYENRDARQEIMKNIEKELKLALFKSDLKNALLLGREKHLYGIYKKMISHHTSFLDIMDMYSFRIIVNNNDNCYRVLGIVHSLYKPVPGKFKDFIAIPKSNGYQSLHTTLFGPYSVPIEIQIRTQTMDQLANYGIAAHWLYKSGEQKTDAAHIRAQQWVNKLLEMQQSTGSSLEFIDNVRTDLFPDEVYVFTPKGNIMELPRGATAVDFAYAVHTDIGNTCIAARIDRQFLPLSTILTNGQTISIITAPGAKPNPVWLNFVTTGKARSGIRNYLKSQKKIEVIALGKQLFEKALSELKMDLPSIPESAIKKILKQFNLTELNQLYEEIGLGDKLATFVAHQLINAAETKLLDVTEELETRPLTIRGSEGLAITFSACCHPIPGDQIVGYLNTGHGLDIHTEDCQALAKLRKNIEKFLPVRWADDLAVDYKVAINVEMMNQRGALASLAKAIAESNSNIDDITINERSGDYYLVTLILTVKNISHLERILRHIKNIPFIVGVTRKK